MNIPLSQPSITEAEIDAVTYAIQGGWVSGTGPAIEAFEQRLCHLTQRKYAVAVTNGTAALELALNVLGVGPGDEVIVPALTFAAPAAAVLNAGATPVLVDIHPVSWTLDPEKVARALTAKTRAVIAVDLLGHPADYEALYDAIGDHEVEVIEDAAEAHGAWYRDRPCGAWGELATFSFHANKAISTGEGGALLTNRHVWHEYARLIAHHGMTAQRPYYHSVAGHNYRMTNLTAALGCAQLQRWAELVVARLDVMQAYNERLPQPFESRPQTVWAKLACWLYTVRARAEVSARAVQHLRSRGVDARHLWPALVDLPLYKLYAKERQQDGYRIARAVSREAFWLPTWAGMPLETIETVSDALAESVRKEPIHD